MEVEDNNSIAFLLESERSANVMIPVSIQKILPNWPEWALNLLALLSVILVAVLYITNQFTSVSDGEDKKLNDCAGGDAMNNPSKRQEFRAFRRQYLIVYLCVILADWMQGTHMYTLFLSYNVNVSALFLTGFLSGAVSAPFMGSVIDKFGRKRSCVVYCILEIVVNLLEHSPNFRILLVGRVLAGISANLLFSAFESWMTTEYHRRGFPEAWMSIIFPGATIGSGCMAIIAGIISQLLDDRLGHIGPFQGAIMIISVALILVLQWEENYGEEKGQCEESSLHHRFTQGWKTTCSDSRILKIGIILALSEGAMYTFVFMWVPTLLSMAPPGGVPTGCVFSSLMIAVTLGGVLFPFIQTFARRFVSESNVTEACGTFIYGIAGFSMAIPAICLSNDTLCFHKILFAFVLMEICVGVFTPISGTLRTKYVPDALHGAILNIFRLPLNAIVVLGTYIADIMKASHVFMLISGCFIIAAFIQMTMITRQPANEISKKKD